ncbi:hypothetical protein Pmani_009645 [Petrolisthes manimaculis]|uniref:Uncharacterized protein n=1 Tax=Petrolisthes manimaculis TaxID=1843537 RepID=A0AAE1Q328_9EUCA|nr:hypothetical protein Pmani_009645 [Petrolisthes manimaculis]
MVCQGAAAIRPTNQPAPILAGATMLATRVCEVSESTCQQAQHSFSYPGDGGRSLVLTSHLRVARLIR